MRPKVFWLTILTAIFILTGLSAAEEKPGLLSGAYPQEKLKELILAADAWHPFPKASEREQWHGLPEAVRSAHIRLAENHLRDGWQTPRASLFLDFVRNGNRSRYEEVSFGRRTKLAELVLGECLEGKGRFLDEILDGIWTICEETYWGVPAHVGAQKRGPGLPDVSEPTVDLFAAETGMLLAWTDYLLGEQLDKLSPLVRERIRYELEGRILAVNLERDDFWWMGIKGQKLNNWTPWICSNWLAAVLLLENDAEKRIQSVQKILSCLDRFLAPYPADGGCDEGPGYWDRAGGSLYDCLELLHSASQGRINVFDQPLIKGIARYIGRAYIHDRYYINFADAASKLNASASLIFRFGRSINDQDLTGFGAFLAKQQGLGKDALRGSFGVLGRALPALFQLEDLLNAPPKEPLWKDVWLPDLQVMAARSQEKSAAGLYLAAKGGHNDESHNHNDVGNFIIYADGFPALIDVGVETYTAKTFSSRRYEIWTMQSGYHNLPTINGVMQKNGLQFQARDVLYKTGPEEAVFSLDIGKAYPEEAGVLSWKRTLRFVRGSEVILEERYALQKIEKPLLLTLISCRQPEIAEEGRIILKNPENLKLTTPLSILYDKGFFKANIETISIEDERLRSSWGDKIYRILLTVEKTPLKGEYTVRFSTEKNLAQK